MNQRNQSKEQHTTIQNYELKSEVNVIINGYNIISIIMVHNTFHDDRMKDEGTSEKKNNQFKIRETQEHNENNSKSNL